MRLKFLIQVCLMAFSACNVFAQPTDKSFPISPVGNTYAIVIGISSYQDPDIPKLSFSNKDAIVFSDFLMSVPGGSVPSDNIKLLTDSMATIGEVDKAIRWLMSNCKENDKVFFYFSGHGEMENVTMSKNGYLICYNTPSVAFVNMGLSIDYLNDVVNTISVQTKAKVVVITDACHSGQMNGKNFKGSLFVGEQLMLKKENEIRMASCKPDELSNENENWGGGRGVFSYYLVNALQGGLADANHDGVVGVGELKAYMEASMAKDPVLKSEGDVQTPVINGSADFGLAKVVASERKKIEEDIKRDSFSIVRVLNATAALNDEDNTEPADYFFIQLKKQNLAGLTDSLKLNTLGSESIAFAIIKNLIENAVTEKAKNKLLELENELKIDKGKFSRFNLDIASTILDAGQNVITNYIRGDEAELERRRYYNSSNSGYDVYTRMFSVALKLSKGDKYYSTKAAVFLHYFSGLVLRFKIVLTAKPKSVIEAALAEQKKALALETHAAYIYNELGILYMAQNNRQKAEENYLLAAKLSPYWALPRANLAYLYTVNNSTAKAFEACGIADSLQSGLPCVSNTYGLLYGNAGNQLLAEEYYRASISLNSRHYLPFQRLGFVYLNTTRYALADSFFYEAELRKKGLHFIKGNPYNDFTGDGIEDSLDKECVINELDLQKNDPLAFFYLAMRSYNKKDTAKAVKLLRHVIDLDKTNPLAFHYLGKIYYEQRKWAEAEIFFKYAMDYRLDSIAIAQYCKAAAVNGNYTIANNCLPDFFIGHNYIKIEDYYFLATAYEKWQHFNEAELMYRAIISTDENETGAYLKLSQLLEKLGRFTEAENVIKSYAAIDRERADRELNTFYRRVLEKYPDNADWNYRLGLLLYNRSAVASTYEYLDSIVWFPNLNKEIFVDIGNLFDINNSTDFAISESLFLRKRIDQLPQEILLPGIRENVKFAAEIYTPRKDGIKYLSRAAELISEKDVLADIYYKIGKIYVSAGSKKQAYPAYLKSLQLYPDNSSARQELVDVLAGIYKNNAALEQLTYLYDHGEIDFSKRLLLADMEMYAGQFEASNKQITEAENQHPYKLSQFDEMKGKLYLLANKTDSAIQFYKDYIKANPYNADAYYSIARLFAGKNNTAQALSWLEQSIKHGFNYSYLLNADPAMDNLRNTKKWNSLVKPDTRPNKRARGVFISDY